MAKENVRRPGDALKNKIRATISYTVRTVAVMFAHGPLMQTFLSVVGFDSYLIYIHSSLIQAANVLTLLLFSSWANNDCPIRRSAFTTIPTGLLFLLYIPVAIGNNASIEAYILLAGVGVAQQVSIGLFTICEYKVPYYIYNKDEYGMMLSICGVLSSLLSLGSGALISYLTAIYSFTEIMTVAFVLSAVMMGIAFITTISQKNLLADDPSAAPPDKKEKKLSSVVELFKHATFTHLIGANLMRGFAAGIIGVLATVALDLGHNESLTAAMVSAVSAASLISCAFFAVSAKRISPNLLLVVGSLTIGLTPILLVRDSAVYLAVYTVITVGRTLIDYSVPAMLIKVVPIEIAGPYNAWRLLIQNAGSLIATTVAPLLPIPLLLALTAVFMIVAGFSFHVVCKRASAV